jgi:glycosyltransferase involved in cell wall biosynthesis
MRVLVISTDRRLLEKGSAVFERHRKYAEQFDALDVLVLGGRGEFSTGKLKLWGVGAGLSGFRGIAAFFRALQLARPDMITVQDPFENGLIALILSWWWHIPLHVQVHTDFLSNRFMRHSFTNAVRRFLAPFVLRRATRVRVVSESIKDSLIDAGYTLPPVSILPIFVDVEKYAHLLRTKHDRFKIALLWVGRLEKEKDPLFAIQLLEVARHRDHDVGLTIVGSGSEDERLREYVRARGLERFVDFRGWQEDLRPDFSTADLLLVTSRYEGYSMTLIEALAARIPVLSLDVGVARDAGALVVGKPKEMGRALLDWISHGPRKGELQSYPYRDEEEYIRAWCEDVRRSHLG